MLQLSGPFRGAKKSATGASRFKTTTKGEWKSTLKCHAIFQYIRIFLNSELVVKPFPIVIAASHDVPWPVDGQRLFMDSRLIEGDGGP